MSETGPSVVGAPPVLSLRGLCIDARTPAGLKRVVDDVSFDLREGETLCLAGESGSGKSVTALSCMGLLPRATLRVVSGEILLGARNLAALPEHALRRVRGGEVAMIFQEPMTSLNPVMRVGEQVMEAIRVHQPGLGGGARAAALRMLDAVRIGDAPRRLGQYPHELSGGMRQRVMIAMALSCRPKVLIADEPTTALDVTVQAQILALMRELRRDFKAAILLITHDMGVVAEMADQVAVMHEGRIIEQGDVLDLFERPRQAYTRQLLAAVPRLGAWAGSDGPARLTPRSAPEFRSDATGPAAAWPVLEVRNLQVTYAGGANGWGRAAATKPTVDGLSFTLATGQTLGLVGESGSGKSTTGKAVLGLLPFSGSVLLNGREIRDLGQRSMRAIRRSAQMIFQDPYASLDSRMSIGDAIAEPLLIHGIGNALERRDRVAALLRRVGLSPDAVQRYPHEFSGGQRQRICIARALALEPRLIVADESVAALDVSVRARVLDLMLELQEQMGLSYLFISHDMAVVEKMSHQVAVMRAGRIVEMGSRRQVFESPRDDYTRGLLAAVPIPDPRRHRTAA